MHYAPLSHYTQKMWRKGGLRRIVGIDLEIKHDLAFWQGVSGYPIWYNIDITIRYTLSAGSVILQSYPGWSTSTLVFDLPVVGEIC